MVVVGIGIQGASPIPKSQNVWESSFSSKALFGLWLCGRSPNFLNFLESSPCSVCLTAAGRVTAGSQRAELYLQNRLSGPSAMHMKDSLLGARTSAKAVEQIDAGTGTNMCSVADLLHKAHYAGINGQQWSAQTHSEPSVQDVRDVFRAVPRLPDISSRYPNCWGPAAAALQVDKCRAGMLGK